MAEEFSFSIRGPSDEGGKGGAPSATEGREPDVEEGGFSFSARHPAPEDYSFNPSIERGKSLTTGAISAGAGALTGAGVGAINVLGRNTKSMQKSIDALASVMAKSPDTAEKIIASRGGLPPPTGPAAIDPAGGRGTYNWAKAFGAEDLEATKARNMAEAWQMKKQADVALQKIQGLAPEFKGVPERGGLMLPEYSGSGPRGASRASLPAPAAPKQNPLASVGQFMQSNPVLSRTAAGGLSGFGAGFGAMEAARKKQEGDIPGFVLSALGAIGSAGSIFPATAPVAAPLAIAAPLAGELLEGVRAERRANIPAARKFEGLGQPSPEEIAEVEAMGPAMSRREFRPRP
jgi:hypothetical protein